MTHQTDNAFDSQALRFIKSVEHDEVAALNESSFTTPLDAQAYREVLTTWHATELLDESDIDELMALDDDHAEESVAQANPSKGFLRPIINWSIAASVVVLLTSYLMIFSGQQSVYDVAVGNQKNILLSDGSELTAASNSHLVVSESWYQREVELTQGSVFFEIAPNRFKPFTIDTPNSKITVLGTAFSVYTHQDRDEIVVTHGRVSVENKQTSYELTKQQKLTITPDQMTLETSVNTKQETSWLDGTLVFHQEPLKLALEKINQFHHTPIQIARNTMNKEREAEIHRIKLSGTFSADNLDEFLTALEVITDVNIKKSESGTILLY